MSHHLHTRLGRGIPAGLRRLEASATRFSILCGFLLLGSLGAPLLAGAQAVFAPQTMGTSSAAQSVTVTDSAGGTVSSVAVLTQGASGLDFAASSGSSTCPGATLSAGQTCTQWVNFTPTAPGVRTGAVVLLNAAGSVLGISYLSGSGQGGLAVFTPGLLAPVAGQYGLFTGTYDGNLATAAE